MGGNKPLATAIGPREMLAEIMRTQHAGTAMHAQNSKISHRPRDFTTPIID